MMKLILFLVLILANVISLLVLLVQSARWGICALRQRDCSHVVAALQKNGVVFGALLFLLILLIVLTQAFAYTPSIKDSNGQKVPGSIAELTKVELNGRKEWISIRGEDKDAPVLLFLAGGPGGTQMSEIRYELAQLEKHFVVVHWDQPGSGKSYHCMNRNEITADTYIDDGVALTEYLRERFGKERIYLMGASWGSALGIFLIEDKPEYYAGFIGAGQMVDFSETERIDYNVALDIARENGNDKLVQKLIAQGEAPYYDGNVAMLSATYLNYLSSVMSSNPEITNGSYNTLRDMFAPEYGVLDSVDYLLGILNTFNSVYPTLYGIDLRESYAKLEVPVYFFIGRHDINAPTQLAQEYYECLQAPRKELVWFEHSGHSVYMNETDKFVQETLRVFSDK